MHTIGLIRPTATPQILYRTKLKGVRDIIRTCLYLYPYGALPYTQWCQSRKSHGRENKKAVLSQGGPRDAVSCCPLFTLQFKKLCAVSNAYAERLRIACSRADMLSTRRIHDIDWKGKKLIHRHFYRAMTLVQSAVLRSHVVCPSVCL